VKSYSERTPCGDIKEEIIGTDVMLTGWVDALRDHGDVLFIHLRDRSGIVQIVFNPAHAVPDVCDRAGTLRNEYCISVTGRVRRRALETDNPNIETGTVEVTARELEIISPAASLPFVISEKAMVAGYVEKKAEKTNEEIRLAYRYLDLRRQSMQKNLVARHRMFRVVRDYLDGQGFIEVETPILTRSTPEGARDYLVPSRIRPQHFYALPQSPQLFKQLLMIGGLDRYFQIARCFRDEDLRPNRQPEFTQLDMEASFIDEEFIFTHVEELLCRLFHAEERELPRPFPRMSWREAMETTGSDRPDLRFGLRLVDATDLLADTSYAIFRRIIDHGGCIKGFTIPGQSGQLSKNVLQNEYAKKIVPSFGAKGMTWMKVTGGNLESNIVQFFSEKERADIRERFGARDGDVVVMIADASRAQVCHALGLLRLDMAERLGIIPDDALAPVWITEFPLFEEIEGRLSSNHHPFTAPDRIDFDPSNREELLALRSRSYDIVVNGEELGGGSMRIRDAALQRKIFTVLGLSEEVITEKFGFFMEALNYGAPPHGGIALGMDRLLSMILGTPSIRDVIAFPKNRSAACPLTGAPSRVDKKQLAELRLFDLGVDRRIPRDERKAS